MLVVNRFVPLFSIEPNLRVSELFHVAAEWIAGEPNKSTERPIQLQNELHRVLDTLTDWEPRLIRAVLRRSQFLDVLRGKLRWIEFDG
jgi:hypothetical protein